jgi:hypothetical protein
MKSNMESRCNRIPDWALLDHANSLSKYEILPDSDKVFGDLLQSSDDSDEKGEQSNADIHELKLGWENRLLRHHEKIIRAKNNIGNSATRPTTPSQKADSANKPSQKSSNKNAVPPPRLISVLRQIFDSPSSGDLKGLLSSSGESNKGGKSDSQQQQQVNVLPSLLHAVVNHPAFSSQTSALLTTEDELSSSVKRHLSDLFGSPHEKKEEEEGKAAEESNDADTVTTPPVSEVEPPGAANLEAIIGNVCRDLLKSSKSSSSCDNSNIHGLLIASLSILTGSLPDEDTLDEFWSTEVQSTSTSNVEGGSSPKSPDSSWNATPDSYLQVGGLLSLLNPTTTNSCGNKFLVDKSLSRYFAEASSVYEERIEIQKALLQAEAMTKTGGGKDDEFHSPKDYK